MWTRVGIIKKTGLDDGLIKLVLSFSRIFDLVAVAEANVIKLFFGHI